MKKSKVLWPQTLSKKLGRWAHDTKPHAFQVKLEDVRRLAYLVDIPASEMRGLPWVVWQFEVWFDQESGVFTTWYVPAVRVGIKDRRKMSPVSREIARVLDIQPVQVAPPSEVVELPCLPLGNEGKCVVMYCFRHEVTKITQPLVRYLAELAEGTR